jgi:uncharacterized protein (DUF305 family)
MRKSQFRKAIMIAMLFTACNKDDTKQHLQAHADNKMMASLHDMMNDIDTIPRTDDPEIDFLKIMQDMHHGALNMANVLFDKGINDSLKNIAQQATTISHEEIYGKFHSYLDTSNVNNTIPEYTKEIDENLNKMMKVADIQFITGDVDNDYATLMIPQQQAEIENAMTYLKYGTDPTVRLYAQSIIEFSNMEIGKLSNWLITYKR